MPPSGTIITIAATNHKPNIHVTVSDNGQGIKHGDEEKIFDKFYGGTSSDGSLGLAICRGIIHAHNGKIWAQNADEGTGAVFNFTLPIKTVDGE